jgi:hypothetical protein
VLALGFGLWGWRASGSGRPPESRKAACAAAKNTRPIGEVRLGERVLGENPELAGSACIEQEPDPATWRRVALRMPEGEGWLAVELLRPVEWIEENHVQPGGVVSLHLPELGAEGEAEVLSLGPCPPIKSGAGHVVTGRFLHHSASNMLDLRVEGEREPIGVTANHPFWSEDRQAFVPAGELQPGERLRAESGVSRVASLTRCPDEAVCNLEVNGQHVYQVSSLGVLVHNSYGSAKEEMPEDFQSKATKLWSAIFSSEGAARAFARTKLGNNPIEYASNKLRSIDGRWQYRAKPCDFGNRHVHLEQLNPLTGEVIQNVHLRWPEGSGR